MSTELNPYPDLTVWTLTNHAPFFMPSDFHVWFTLVKTELENYRITSVVLYGSLTVSHKFFPFRSVSF